MPISGDPWPNNWASSTAATTVGYWTYTDNVTGHVVPLQAYPAVVAMPAESPSQEDESPLAWLRGQVAEVCELARAA